MMMMMKFMFIFLLCFFIHTQTSNANVASVDATQMNMPYNPLVELRKQYVPPEIAIFDWVRSHGGIVDGVAIFSPKNKPRGLYTTKQFKNGTMLLSIPNEVMIHRGFVLNEKKNPAFVSYYRGHSIDGKNYFIGHGLQAIKDMDAGEEIFDNYSPLSETHLCTINILITFGFLEPERGYDCYEFTVNATFDGESKFVAEKIALFNAFGIPRTLSVTLRGSTLDSMRERFPEDYLIFMRIMSISNINQYKTGMIVANGIKAGTHSRKTVWSLDNEHNTLRSLKKQASNIQLHNFETTVEEDLQILQLLDSKLNDSSITSYKTLESYRQQKLIVGLRRREHEVVSTLIDFADEKWMNLLNAKILNSDI